MIKQVYENRIEKLEQEVSRQKLLIRELLAALTCPSEEIRMLVRDTAELYIKDENEKYSEIVQLLELP